MEQLLLQSRFSTFSDQVHAGPRPRRVRRRRENITAIGPSGVGKTHVALGIGLAARQRGINTRFATVAAIVLELIEAFDDKRLLLLQKPMATVELLIIDELGFAPCQRPAPNSSSS